MESVRIVRQAATLETGEELVMYGLEGKGLYMPYVTPCQCEAQRMADLLNTPDLADEHLPDVAQYL